MKRVLLFALVCVSLFYFSASGVAPADEPKTVGVKPLPLFHDDFSTDTRERYKIEGEVKWKENSLLLSDGASISRKLDAGSWVEADLNLKFPEDEDVQVVLRFTMEGATDFLVLWRRKIEKGESRAEVFVLDTNPQAEPGKQIITMLRQPLETLPAGLWRQGERI